VDGRKLTTRPRTRGASRPPSANGLPFMEPSRSNHRARRGGGRIRDPRISHPAGVSARCRAFGSRPVGASRVLDAWPGYRVTWRTGTGTVA
jgi:hypothetical protein